jgi:hypothetical protein
MKVELLTVILVILIVISIIGTQKKSTKSIVNCQLSCLVIRHYNFLRGHRHKFPQEHLSMEEEAALNEPLSVKKSTAWTLKTFTLLFLGVLTLLMVLFLINCLLALLLSSYNAMFLMGDVLSARIGIIYGPTATFVAGIGAQLLSEYGSQALSIFGLCLIVAVVMLIRLRRVTMKSLWISIWGFVLICCLPSTFGIVYEVCLVMTSGPSKLRSKMLRILGYEFLGFYVLILCGFFNILSSHFEKLKNEGKEVPWFFSAVVFKIKKTLNFQNIMTTARHLPSYIYMIYMVWQCNQIILDFVIYIFDLRKLFGSGRKGVFFVLVTSSVITGCICLSIIAKSGPSFTEVHSIFTRDMFVCTTSLIVAVCAIIVSGMIGFLVQMATGCSDAYAPIVLKTTELTSLTAMMCACIYFKLTGTYFADLYTEFEKSCTPPPPHSTEDTALLADTQPTEPCDIAKLENATEHNESWGPTDSIAITGTGTSRDNTSYRLLSDAEIGEMPMGACKTSTSRMQFH